MDDLREYPVEGGDLPPIPDRSEKDYASWRIRLLACFSTRTDDMEKPIGVPLPFRQR